MIQQYTYHFYRLLRALRNFAYYMNAKDARRARKEIDASTVYLIHNQVYNQYIDPYSETIHSNYLHSKSKDLSQSLVFFQ